MALECPPHVWWSVAESANQIVSQRSTSATTATTSSTNAGPKFRSLTRRCAPTAPMKYRTTPTAAAMPIGHQNKPMTRPMPPAISAAASSQSLSSGNHTVFTVSTT